jgi:molybdopterin-binding protein
MQLSARTQLKGRIVAVQKDGIMAEVQVEMDAGSVTAAITAGSATSLALAAGDEVTVIVKATEVLIGK